MKQKFSSIIAIGLAAVSADARNHIRSRQAHPEREGSNGGNVEQIRRIQTQTTVERHHLCIYSEFAKGVQCDQLWRDRGHAALMRISQSTDADDSAPPTIDTWGLWPDLNDDIIDAGLSNVLGGSDAQLFSRRVDRRKLSLRPLPANGPHPERPSVQDDRDGIGAVGRLDSVEQLCVVCGGRLRGCDGNGGRPDQAVVARGGGDAVRAWRTHPAAEWWEGFADRGCARLMAKMRARSDECKCRLVVEEV